MTDDKPLTSLDNATLTALHDQLSRELELQRANRLSLDLTRGKPAADQLDLSAGLHDAVAGRFIAEDGSDSRNYGDLTGIPEAKALGAEIMDVPAEQIICWGNSSLTLMHLCVNLALVRGLWNDHRRWQREPAPKMLTPVPGYDRHFTVCESHGIAMVNVAMGPDGPDMDAVESAAREDPTIKGIWCVPKYSNPTGCIYSPECVQRMAELPKVAAADDFVVFWDNAYAVHDFHFPSAPLAPILQLAASAGTTDHVVVFASTSKITYPSAGLAFLASGTTVLKTFEQHLGTFSIGPDKVNQLRHARFLRGRVMDHMAGHAALIKPKFELVDEILTRGLAHLDVATWTKPEGGYFVSLTTLPGLARRVGELAASVGLKLTAAGATFPYGNDPEDSNLRIAPTFATMSDLEVAMEVLVLCIKLASVESRMQRNPDADDRA